MLFNSNMPHLVGYLNSSDFTTDITVEVRSKSGELLGTLHAPKVFLCQNSICKKMLENNKTITMVSSLAAVETFIDYLHSHRIEKTKITPDLIKIGSDFQDLFLMSAGKTAVMENLKRRPFEKQIDEFLLAVENENSIVWTELAKYIAENYDIFKLCCKEFSKITDDKMATTALIDALGSSNEQLRKRLNATKLQFELHLSWTERAVYNFVVGSTKWKFEVYRVIEENEEWLYFDYKKLTTDTMVLDNVFVKLLPNPEQNINRKVAVKTCEANKYSQTKFLNWTLVMDPQNGYINKGVVKMEFEYSGCYYLPARKSAPGKVLAPKRAKKAN